MRPSTSAGNFTADRARGRKSAGGPQTLLRGPERREASAPSEPAHRRPAASWGLRHPRWPEDGAAQHGLPTLWPKLAASQRGQKPAGRTPLGNYSLIKRRRAWTPRGAGCAPTACSFTRGRTLGSETYGLTPGLTAVKEPGTWSGWYFKGGLVPSLSRVPQTSFFPFHLSLFFLSAHP